MLTPDITIDTIPQLSIAELSTYLSRPILSIGHFNAIKDHIEDQLQRTDLSDDETKEFGLVFEKIKEISNALHHDLPISQALSDRKEAEASLSKEFNLYDDVLKLILKYLSIDERLPLRFVSKQFHKLIEDMPISENFIFQKNAGLILQTRYRNQENELKSHHSYKEFIQYLKNYSSSRKDQLVKEQVDIATDEADTLPLWPIVKNAGHLTLVINKLVTPLIILASSLPTITYILYRAALGMSSKHAKINNSNSTSSDGPLTDPVLWGLLTLVVICPTLWVIGSRFSKEKYLSDSVTEAETRTRNWLTMFNHGEEHQALPALMADEENLQTHSDAEKETHTGKWFSLFNHQPENPENRFALEQIESVDSSFSDNTDSDEQNKDWGF